MAVKWLLSSSSCRLFQVVSFITYSLKKKKKTLNKDLSCKTPLFPFERLGEQRLFPFRNASSEHEIYLSVPILGSQCSFQRFVNFYLESILINNSVSPLRHCSDPTTAPSYRTPRFSLDDDCQRRLAGNLVITFQEPPAVHNATCVLF